MTRDDQNKYMEMAIEMAVESGTPFAAIIVNENKECISAVNSVRSDLDATAHAEINVIRKLKDMNLSDRSKLTLVTTCEPCPMCMSAVIWAGIGKVVFGCSINDIKNFKNQIGISSLEVAQKSWYPLEVKGGIRRDECLSLFHIND
jgi:tRNA(Arg) A34 adenosine deaminase TadA